MRGDFEPPVCGWVPSHSSEYATLSAIIHAAAIAVQLKPGAKSPSKVIATQGMRRPVAATLKAVNPRRAGLEIGGNELAVWGVRLAVRRSVSHWLRRTLPNDLRPVTPKSNPFRHSYGAPQMKKDEKLPALEP